MLPLSYCNLFSSSRFLPPNPLKLLAFFPVMSAGSVGGRCREDAGSPPRRTPFEELCKSGVFHSPLLLADISLLRTRIPLPTLFRQ